MVGSYKDKYLRWFEFIRYSLSPEKNIIPNLDGLDWYGLYQFSCKQSIIGVVYEGIRLLGRQCKGLPLELLFQWTTMAEQISGLSKKMNRKCQEIIKEYKNAGFDCCILKGQGIARLYNKPDCRMPGDIDILVMSKIKALKSKDKLKKDLLRYVYGNYGKNVVSGFYHMSYEQDGIEVEVHFIPGIINNPFYNWRLQKWYKTHLYLTEIAPQYDGYQEELKEVKIPNLEFNVVFQLAHMMHHFFDEGVGLRQMMDYYYVLKAFDGEEWKIEIQKTLRYLGLEKFAMGVMWVLHEVFGLDEIDMIVPMDEKKGNVILQEVLKGGNFGKYTGSSHLLAVGTYFYKICRSLHFVKEFPSEALFMPFTLAWIYMIIKIHHFRNILTTIHA